MNRPIRILHVVHRNPFGGIYRVVCDILGSLHEQVEFHAALVYDPSFTDEFNFGDVEIPTTLIRGSVIERFRQLLQLARQFDVVHLHGYTPWEAMAVRLSGAKVIFTNHGLLGVGRKLRWYEHIKRIMMGEFFRRGVDHVANISQYAMRRIIAEYNVAPNKNSVVYNGTPWPAMPPRVEFGDVLHLGYHGRFVWFKRIDRFLEVAAKVEREHPLRLTLVGDGMLKDDLVAQSNALGLDAEFTGYRMDARDLVRSFDVEIISSDEEYFGVAVLESIQAGHPTFVFADGGGCTEIFDERAGWFVCRDLEDMAEKILMLRSPQVRTRVLSDLEYMQERVRRTFSRATLGAGYLAIYRRLANRETDVVVPAVHRSQTTSESSW